MRQSKLNKLFSYKYKRHLPTHLRGIRLQRLRSIFIYKNKILSEIYFLPKNALSLDNRKKAVYSNFE